MTNFSDSLWVGLGLGLGSWLLVGTAQAAEKTASGQEGQEAGPALTPEQELKALWTAQTGYTLRILAKGLAMPTSLAAVPEPDPAPGSPQLFIGELRGGIKTLSQDGKVADFAKVSTFVPRHEWPHEEGEAGMAGLCLDPEHGYVFVTYAYRDGTGLMRNGITRFTAEPRTFKGPGRDMKDLGAVLVKEPSAFSHQIGTCQVHGGLLYVGVGDAGNPSVTGSKESALGKVLRMTLDGDPAPANPFAADPNPIAQRVFASGLRNPFALVFFGDRLFAGENGVALDRFLELSLGGNYHWDGTDHSIATNALAVFSPTIGPVQALHLAPNAANFAPLEADRFLIAASDGQQGPGVIELQYRAEEGRLARAPRYLVHYEGTAPGQAVAGIALTKDGLCFTPIIAVGGTGVLLATRYEPAAPPALGIGQAAGGDPIRASGCLGCHSLQGVGAQVGPALDQNSLLTRIQTRVLAAEYPAELAKLDALGDERAVKGREARRQVLSAPEEARVQVWIANRLLYPQFDNLDAQMPPQNVTRGKADEIATFLSGVGGEAPPLWRQLLVSRRVWGGFVLGIAASVSGLVALTWLKRRGKRAASSQV